MLDLTPQVSPDEELGAKLLSAVLMIVAAGLAVIIGRRPPLWAVLLVAAWAVVEVVTKLALVLERVPQAGNVVTPLFMAILVTLVAILAVRGALALRRLPASA